jgi:hypothetical protein
MKNEKNALLNIQGKNEHSYPFYQEEDTPLNPPPHRGI